jgi:fatty acid elongase 3
MGNCAGEEFAAFAGIAILSSYLLLFISFYFATYQKTAKTGRPRSNTGKRAVIEMRHFEVPSPISNGHTKTNGSASNGATGSTSRQNGPVTRSRKA